MAFLLIKLVHILSAILLFGTGLGTAYFMWQANRSRNVRVIAHTSARVVLADWLFTLPTVILQPLSGYALLQLGGYPPQGWVTWSLLLFTLAGTCWLPVVWLQIRMRDLSNQALAAGQQIPGVYWRYARFWLLLGIPAFIAMLSTLYLMVFKPL